MNTNKEIKAVINPSLTPQQRKALGQMALWVNSTSHSNNSRPSFLNSSKKWKEEEILSNSSEEVSITLIPNKITLIRKRELQVINYS